MGKISSVIRTAIGKKRFCSAVILAAGVGSRFKSDTPKQFFEIAGEPVLLHTARAFEQCELVDEIIVVTAKDEIDRVRLMLKNRGITKLTRVTEGGDTRMKSARNGFEAINPESEFVAIHDAARCLVTPEIIESVFESAFVFGAAICGAVCTDTLKRSDFSDTVLETVDRNNMWRVETPQIFDTRMYRASVYYADKDGINVTDDSALCEHAGFKVKIVESGRTNIKITYPEDIIVAEAILRSRKETNK